MTLAEAQTTLIDLPGYRLGKPAFETATALHFHARDAQNAPVLIRVPHAGDGDMRTLASYRFGMRTAQSLGDTGCLVPREVVSHPLHVAMIFEPFDGDLLETRIRPDGMRIECLIDKSVELTRAIDTLHLKGVAHRDLSPDACLVARDGGEIRLISLESAVVLLHGGGTSGEELAVNSHYAAPEMTGCMEVSVDFRADLYSLGACIFHMATGHPPFQRVGHVPLAYAHVTQPVPDLWNARPELPRVFCDIVTRLLQKGPDDRYDTAHGVLHDLSVCAQEFHRSGTVRPFDLARQDKVSSFEISDKPYGGAKEFDSLMNACNLGPRQGQRTFATVSGTSGIGKTTLVDRLRVPLAVSGVQFLTGKFDQFQRDKPYLAFAEAASNLMRLQRRLSQADQDAMRASFREAVGDYGGLLSDIVPELTELLGPQPDVPEVPPTEAQMRFNAVVGRFFRALATEKSPMVMFIDDLQWADPASLAILETLSETPGLEHLMLILGYRSDEIGAGHPAQRVLGVMKQRAERVVEIEVGPLDSQDVRDLMCDALNRTGPDIDVVADLVHGISSGNPFFVREFLVSLKNRGLIRFDQKTGDWEFDLDGISDVPVPDSVAGMLTDRLVDLAPETLDLLDAASCIGNRFDLRTLARVTDQSMSKAAVDLAPAIAASLIIPLGSNQRLFEAMGGSEQEAQSAASLGNARYRFRHDQARLAVHARLNAGLRAERHLRIGRLLLNARGDTERDNQAMEIFAHFEIGADLITDAAERLSAAELGLQVSKVSRKGLAFATAQAQLAAASALLPADAWECHQDIKLQIEVGLAECAFARADGETLEASAQNILRHVTDPVKTIPLQIMRIRYLATQNKYDEAATIAVSVARTVGVSLPRNPSKFQVLWAALHTLAEQVSSDPRDHQHLPEASDPKTRQAVELLAASCPAAYFSDPNLLPLLGMTGTRLSIRHGLAPGSPYLFAVQALIYCGPLNMIERGYRFGELALAAGKRYGGRDESRAQFVFDTFVRHWKTPLSEVVPALYNSWCYNRDAGDHENATYSAGVVVFTDFLSGRGIDADLRNPDIFDYLVDCDMPHIKDSFLSWLQLLRVLRAPGIGADLQGDLFDYPSKIKTFVAVETRVLAAQCSMAAGMLDFLAGRFERAETRLGLAQKFEENITAQVLVPALVFFRAMNAYRLAESGNRGMLRLARKCRRRLRYWMQFSPANLAHRVALLDAEDHIIKGAMGEALLEVHKAGELAGEQAPLYTYLAHARRADILAMAGRTGEARLAARTAIEHAEKWGALGLANDLRDRFNVPPDLTGTGSDAEAADLAGFMDAVGAIATETNRESLLERVMSNAIGAANADAGLLVQVRPETGPVIEIIRDEQGKTNLTQQALSTAGPLIEAAISRCLETCEVVVSNDPAKDFPVAAENRQDQCPKALLCVPICLHGQTAGALCLTNHLARHVFTPGRIRFSEALGNQAGIALENTRLYGEVQSALRRQTAQAKANQRFVPQALLQALGQRSIDDVELNNAAVQEMTVAFADIRGFTAISRKIGPEKTIRMINRYLSHVQPGIAANGGFVGNYLGDGLLALFPGRTDDALHGAIAMSRGLDGYNRARGDFPELSIGIGVNRGPVTLGMIGDQDHVQCGVLGDAVNVAARIEGLIKPLGARFLVSGPCVAALIEPQRFSLRPIGRFAVQGQTEGLDLFECLDVHANDVRSRLKATLPQFTEAVSMIEAGDLEAAARLFEECDARAGGDSVARRLTDRCRNWTA